MTDPDARVAMVLTLMQQLEGVMQAEHALLREMRIERLRELQAEKAGLAEHYELELRRLRTSPETLAAASPEGRAALETGMRGFRVAVRRNAERLAQARDLVEGVVRALGEGAAGPQVQGGYGAALRPPAEGGRVLAFAVDRRC
jgi:hypothetical protein